MLYYDNRGNELSEYDLEEMYDDMLNEVYGSAEIAGIKFSTSRALQEVDPTEYRAGFLDYVDSLERSGDISETHPDEEEEED